MRWLGICCGASIWDLLFSSFSQLSLAVLLPKYGALISNNNELPARAFETGCWCRVPVVALVP